MEASFIFIFSMFVLEGRNINNTKMLEAYDRTARISPKLDTFVRERLTEKQIEITGIIGQTMNIVVNRKLVVEWKF